MPGIIGKPKFDKYFKSKTVDTLVKGDAPLYDVNKTNQKIATIPKGTAIKVLPKAKWEEYDKKYLVEATVSGKKIKGLLADASVAKPMAKSGVGFKPQNLGIKENANGLDTKTIVKTVLEGLEKNGEVNEHTRLYLIYLLEQCSFATKKTVKFEQINFKKIPHDDLNQIRKDFGEIIGALAAINDDKVFPTLKIDKNSRADFPSAGNEPLLDFRLITKEGAKTIKYSCSSKSGTTTNTIKPDDIIKLLMKNPPAWSKWKNSLEVEILKILGQYGAIEGALNACNFLNTNPKYKKYAYKKSVAGLLKDAANGKRDPAFILEVYNCEKHVVDVSRQLNYTDLFFDAITGQVYYINLTGFDAKGLPIWKTSGESKEQNQDKVKKVVFRSKNTTKSMNVGRMGLQM